ncbi:MAG: SDR family NAD(P)-dependent oxidoreductase [Phycisphaerales bacterium JB041]
MTNGAKNQSGTCFVIGASGGIGSALVSRLRASGWGLVLAGRAREPLVRLASTDDAPVEVLDAADFDAVSEAMQRHEGLTAAVNLAGSILLKPAHQTSAAEFDETISQNLRSAFATVRGAAQSMRTTGGSVVLVSSCAASVGIPNHEAISAAKAGIEGLTRAAAATYATGGLRINAVAPGLVDTPMASRLTGNPAALRASTVMHPLGRIGTPDDIARAIIYLLEPANDWMTGQVLGVDGGLARVRGR